MGNPSPAPTEIVQTHTPLLFEEAVRHASAMLRAGELVAIPTETVYGLAANAFDPNAVRKIYEAKDRPPHNPIIVHIATLDMAKSCVACWPVAADKLMAAFWPGPLTVVLPKSSLIPDIVTAGGNSVGLRWPGHPFIQAVIRECGFPLAAPSANPSGQVSPTNAGHVLKELGGKIKLIVDGGQSQVGIESTVIDLTVQPPRVLRPGMIHAESLMAVVGELEADSGMQRGPLKSPGLLVKHYAPRAKLVTMRWQNDADLRRQLSERFPAVKHPHIIAHTRIPSTFPSNRVGVIPHDAEAFARAIYGELHRCDEEGAQLIIVEALPETSEWHAVADRLRRASAE